MKIVIFGHKYVPSREGGVEIVVENLAVRLAKAGHDVTILNRKRKQYKPISEYKGCRIENIFTVNNRSLDAIVYAFFATLKARRLIKKRLADIVHIHAEGPCNFLGLLPKKEKRSGTKVIVTIHGLDWQRGKWGGFASRIIKRGERKAVKYADEIIVLSENNKHYFADTYNRQTTYIPNGVNKAEFYAPDIIKEKYGLDKGSYVLFLSRIVPEKGVHYLIDAWDLVKNRIKTDKKLVIAGGSSHSDEYFESVMHSAEKDHSIITTGFVEGQLLRELLSNAYLYVLPSDIEGMPMSLLEAGAYGLPTLTSDIPENTEVVGTGGVTFKKGDVSDLADKLEMLLAGIPAHMASPKIKSWEEVVEKTMEVYKK